MDTPLLIIRPRAEDVEGQPILRPLPSAKCRNVGPFVFFDHMLETIYPTGKGMDIRQHPHIGLSTLTYLFEGQLQHKDSLGSDQVVGAGDVSWMTAGSAIAHVERTPAPLLAETFTLHGLQVWLASPKAHEQGPGHYSHHPAATLPLSDNLGVQIRMIAGSGFCLESPVPVLSPTLGLADGAGGSRADRITALGRLPSPQPSPRGRGSRPRRLALYIDLKNLGDYGFAYSRSGRRHSRAPQSVHSPSGRGLG